MRCTALLVGCLLVLACGSSPSSPSPTPTPTPTPTPAPVTFSGRWNGQMALTVPLTPDDPGTVERVAVQFNLSQSASAVFGTWLITNAGNDAHGDVSGSVSGDTNTLTFSGTLTWDSSAATGDTRCTGSGSFTGTITRNTADLSGAGGFALAACTSPTKATVQLTPAS